MTALLYVHPNGYPLPMTLPVGVLSNINAIDIDKEGFYQSELDEETIKKAQFIALSLHWYMPLASVIDYVEYIKRVNPAITVIVGGMTANIYAPILIERSKIDYIVGGDTEAPFRSLVNALADGRGSEDIPSLPNTWSSSHQPEGLSKHSHDSYNELNWWEHDWFPSFALWVRAVHEEYIPGPGIPEQCYPNIPLMRGCTMHCPNCFGTYQRYIFKRKPLAMADNKVVDLLDNLETAGYRFAHFMNGYEIMEIFGNSGIPRKYKLSLTIYLCFLPSREAIENLCDSFEAVDIWITSPEDDIPFNRVQHARDDNFVNTFFDTFQSVARDNLHIFYSRVVPDSQEHQEFEKRLEAEPNPCIELTDSYNWSLPVPSLKLYPDETLEDQYERFFEYSRHYQNYSVARRLCPSSLDIFCSWHALRDVSAPDVFSQELQRALKFHYQDHCLPGLNKIELVCGEPSLSSTKSDELSWVEIPAEKAPASLALSDVRFDAKTPYFEFTLPDPCPLSLSFRLEIGHAEDTPNTFYGSDYLVLQIQSPITPPATLRVNVFSETIELVLFEHCGRQINRYEIDCIFPELSWGNISAMKSTMGWPQELLVHLNSEQKSDGSPQWRAHSERPGTLDIEWGKDGCCAHLRPRSNRPGALSTRLFHVETQQDGDLLDELLTAIRAWEDQTLRQVKHRPKSAGADPTLASFVQAFLSSPSIPVQVSEASEVIEIELEHRELIPRFLLQLKYSSADARILVQPLVPGLQYFTRTKYLAISYVMDSVDMPHSDLEECIKELRELIMAQESGMSPEAARLALGIDLEKGPQREHAIRVQTQ